MSIHPSNGVTPGTPLGSAEDAATFMRRLTNVPFTKRQVWSLARQGILPVLCVGKRFVFFEEGLAAWVAAGGTRYANGAYRKPRPESAVAHSNKVRSGR